MQSFKFPIQQKKNFEKILKTAPVRQLFTKGLQNVQICFAMAKKQPGYLFKLDSRAYLCINFRIFFQSMQCFKYPIQQKKNLEKISKTAPVRQVLRRDVDHTTAKSDWRRFKFSVTILFPYCKAFCVITVTFLMVPYAQTYY